MRFSKVSQKTYRLIHTDRNGNEGLFDAHLARIYRKLDINTRARLAALVTGQG